MKNSTLFSSKTGVANAFSCCCCLLVLLFWGLFSQQVSAQGTLVPACNIIGPLTSCAVADPSDTSGDMTMTVEVARSGVPNLNGPTNNLNFTYSFPSNSSGAFIRTFGTVDYNPITNKISQVITVFPGTTVSEFNLQLDVVNTSSIPNT